MSEMSEKQFQAIMEKLDFLLEENKQLKNMIAHRDEELALKEEQIQYLIHKLYGTKKETLQSDPNQADLFQDDPFFNMPELPGDQSDNEIIEVTKKVRRPKRKGLKQKQLASLPVVEHIHELNDCTCPQCQNEMKTLSTELYRQEVRFIPARIENHKHYRKTYACSRCEKQGETTIIKSDVPKLPLNNTPASASIIAETLYQKFVQKVPAYRQEAHWALLGYPIPRHNMTNWHIKCSNYYFEEVVQAMKKELLQTDVLHADETTFKILEDKERQKSYIWFFSTGRYSERPIHIYHMGPSRGAIVPATFLENYSGFLHCDGYNAYDNLGNITSIACLAHIRRYFNDARPQSYTSESIAHKAIVMCNELFALDKKWATLSVSDRQEKRLAYLKPKLEAFYEWLSQQNVLEKSKLGKAVVYALKQKERLMNVLKDGRLVLSNNIAERGIKSLVMGRKNWLFSQSFKGAQSNAAIMSIIETAKANHLHPRKYIEYLLCHLPNRKNTPLEAYLPWDPKVQAECQ